MPRPKAHHYIPAAHLAAFSPDAGPIRDRKIWVVNKRTGSFRRARIEKVAFENDLYTIRTPALRGDESTYEQLMAAVFDPANKDGDIETLKAEIEERGIRALRAIAEWRPGSRVVSEEEREPVLSYAGLLFAQHPTMMAARAAVVHERMSAWSASAGLKSPRHLEINAEFAKSESVFALIAEAFAIAYELNFLGWKVVRWPTTPRLVVGDNATTLFIPSDPLGVGDVWANDARVGLVVSPTCALFMFQDIPAGGCMVEDRNGNEASAEIDAVNWITWSRARREVYAGSRELLEQLLGNPAAEQIRSSDFSQQLPVRPSLVLDIRTGADGFPSITRPESPGPEDASRRWAERFGQGVSVQQPS